MSPRHSQAIGAEPMNGARHDAETKAARGLVVLVFHPDRNVRESYCEILEAEGQTAAPVADAETAMTLLRELEACGTEAVLLAPIAAKEAPRKISETPVTSEPRGEANASSRPVDEAELSSGELAPATTPPALASAFASDLRAERDGSPSVHICSWCKRARQPDGSWLAPHLFFTPRRRWGPLRLEATHGICEDCYGAAMAQVEVAPGSTASPVSPSP